MKSCAIVLYILSVSAVLSRDHALHHHRGLSQAPQSCGFQAPDISIIEEMAITQEERVARVQQQQQRRQSLPGRLFRCNPELDDNEATDTDTPPEINGTIKITTYVHAIQKADGTGFLSDEVIKQNFKATNQLLSSSEFHLDIVSINRIKSDAWYISEWDSVEQNYMRSQNKRGGLDTLNVYYKAAMMSEFRYCGYANLAENAKTAGRVDGIVMDTGCATDETVLAHEVGCSPEDLVDDTNAQNTTVGRYDSECPNPSPDSCPDQHGSDPLDNIMDYAPLGCDDLFTEGQIQRMKEAWSNIRKR